MAVACFRLPQAKHTAGVATHSATMALGRYSNNVDTVLWRQLGVEGRRRGGEAALRGSRQMEPLTVIVFCFNN
jgi:hypothetical protein